MMNNKEKYFPEYFSDLNAFYFIEINRSQM